MLVFVYFVFNYREYHLGSVSVTKLTIKYVMTQINK